MLFELLDEESHPLGSEQHEAQLGDGSALLISAYIAFNFRKVGIHQFLNEVKLVAGSLTLDACSEHDVDEPYHSSEHWHVPEIYP